MSVPDSVPQGVEVFVPVGKIQQQKTETDKSGVSDKMLQISFQIDVRLLVEVSGNTSDGLNEEASSGLIRA